MGTLGGKSDAGVSESLGFILLTTIMLIGFSVVYVTGMPVYNDYIDDSHMSNIEQSFNIIAFNGNSVAVYKAPFSSSELKMYGGVLATRNTGYMNISYYKTEDPGSLIGYNNTTLTALEYTKGPDRVAFVDGSVCRQTGNISYMIGEPEIYESPDSLVIPTLILSDNNVAAAGSGLTRISFLTPYYSKMSQTVTTPGPAVIDNVRMIVIVVKGDYASCFAQYFKDRFQFTVSDGADGEKILKKTYSADTKLQIAQLYLTVEAK